MMRKWRVWETHRVLLKRSFFLSSPDETHDEEIEVQETNRGAAEEKFLPQLPGNFRVRRPFRT
jgi:hypothetical protein